MARNAAIRAQIQGDNTGFKKSLADSDQAARSWSTRMGNMRQNVARDFNTPVGGAAGGGFLSNIFSLGALAKIAGGIGMVTAAAVTLKKSIDYGDAMRNFVDAFTGIGEDAESVTQQLEALADLAKNPGVAFTQAAEASKNLRALGYTAAETRAIILALGNAMAATGESEDQLAGIVDALTKISDRGEISARQFMALSQATPTIREAFRNMGVETSKDLEKLGTDTKQIIAGIIAELQKLPATPLDFAHKKRIVADQARFLAQMKMMQVGDVISENTADPDTNNPTIRAARQTKLAAAAVNAEEAEARRLADLRLAQQEMALRASIKMAEMESQLAYDLRLELDILTKTDKVMESLGIKREEAVEFLRQNLEVEEAIWDVSRRKAALEKADAQRARDVAENPVQIPRNDPDARNERRFNRSVDMRRKYGTYENYLSRNEETTGSLAREANFSGLDAFKKMQDDPGFGRVKTRREEELQARSERLEKEGKGESEEAKLLKAAEKHLAEIAENTAGQRKGRSEPLRRE